MLSMEKVELLFLRVRRSFMVPRELLVTASKVQFLRNLKTAMTTAWPPEFSLKVLKSWIRKLFFEVKTFLGLLLWRKPLKCQSRVQTIT